MKNTQRTVTVLAAALTLSATASAQNTIIPDPIQSFKPNYWNSDVFATRVPGFALGHQWGAAALDKINTSLKMRPVTGESWAAYSSSRSVS